ncbi:cytochrome c [Peniophora sp. CONT]|nr:cytochrome c [Peniophora sp. CONT]
MPYTPGNPQQGADLFVDLCEHCHTIEEGKPHPYGPNLSGIWGQRAGSIPDYKYSPANLAAGQDGGKRKPLTWDEQTMYEYLRAPKKYIPGTKKPFEGVPSEQDRCALVAYLKQATTPPKEPEEPRNVCFIQ